MKFTCPISLLACTAAAANAQSSPSCPADHGKDITLTSNDRVFTYTVSCGLNAIGPDLARYYATSLSSCAQDCANNGTVCVGATYIQVVSSCVQKSEITEPLAYAASANAQTVVLVGVEDL